MVRTCTRKNKLTLRKCHLVFIEKSIEDVKQDQRTVPDLVESVIKPTDPVKEELRRILCKWNNLGPKSKNSTFYFLDVRRIDGVPPEANTASEPSKF